MDNITSKMINLLSDIHNEYVDEKQLASSYSRFLMAKGESSQAIASALSTFLLDPLDPALDPLSVLANVGVSPYSQLCLADGTLIPIELFIEVAKGFARNAPDDQYYDYVMHRSMESTFTENMEGSITNHNGDKLPHCFGNGLSRFPTCLENKFGFSSEFVDRYVNGDLTLFRKVYGMVLPDLIDDLAVANATNVAFALAFQSLSDGDTSAASIVNKVITRMKDAFPGIRSIKGLCDIIAADCADHFSVSQRIINLSGSVLEATPEQPQSDEPAMVVDPQSIVMSATGSSPLASWVTDFSIDIDMTNVVTTVTSGVKKAVNTVRSFFTQKLWPAAKKAVDKVVDTASNRYFSPAIIVDDGEAGSGGVFQVPLLDQELSGGAYSSLATSVVATGGYSDPISVLSTFSVPSQHSTARDRIIRTALKDGAVKVDNSFMTARFTHVRSGKTPSEDYVFSSGTKKEYVLRSLPLGEVDSQRMLLTPANEMYSFSAPPPSGQRTTPTRYRGDCDAIWFGLSGNQSRESLHLSVYDASMRGALANTLFMPDATQSAVLEFAIRAPGKKSESLLQVSLNIGGWDSDMYKTVPAIQLFSLRANGDCIVPQYSGSDAVADMVVHPNRNWFWATGTSIRNVRFRVLIRRRGLNLVEILTYYQKRVNANRYSNEWTFLFTNTVPLHAAANAIDRFLSPQVSGGLTPYVTFSTGDENRVYGEGISWAIYAVSVSDIFTGPFSYTAPADVPYGEDDAIAPTFGDYHASQQPEGGYLLAHDHETARVQVFVKPVLPSYETINLALRDTDRLHSLAALSYALEESVNSKFDLFISEVTSWMADLFPKSAEERTTFDNEQQMIEAVQCSSIRSLAYLTLLSVYGHLSLIPTVEQTDPLLAIGLKKGVMDRFHDVFKVLSGEARDDFPLLPPFMSDMNISASIANNAQLCEAIGLSAEHGEILSAFFANSSFDAGLSHLKLTAHDALVLLGTTHVSEMTRWMLAGADPMFIPYNPASTLPVVRMRIATDADSAAKFTKLIRDYYVAKAAVAVITLSVIAGVKLNSMSRLTQARLSNITRKLGEESNPEEIQSLLKQQRRMQRKATLLQRLSLRGIATSAVEFRTEDDIDQQLSDNFSNVQNALTNNKKDAAEVADGLNKGLSTIQSMIGLPQ